MKKLILLAAPALLLALTAMNYETPSEPGDKMKEKIRHAQEMLKNLALGDMPAVKNDAEALLRISEGMATPGKSPVYGEYEKEYIRILRELIKESEKQNLAGSYYQFTRMTSVCFSCHEHMRKK